MGATSALRREMKSRFIPHVEQQGFKLDEREGPTFWIFRRNAGTTVQVFSVQWEKYGRPRFRLDLGSCPIEGLSLRGKHFDWRDVHPHWLADTATLRPGSGFLAGTWFRQDRGVLRRLSGLSSPRPPSEVVDELLSAYPHVQNYWSNGSTGRHIRRWAQR
jgi:hypothetical protein